MTGTTVAETPSLFVAVALTGTLTSTLIIPTAAQSQVITDGSAGAQVTLTGPQITIGEALGTRSGNNLFHSFTRFGIGTGETATFTGSSDIANVISRVTGGDASVIEGQLRSEVGVADFYFVNPAGVVFSDGASVDVPGSFHISTADELHFSDGTVLSMTTTSASTLTLAAPESFGFLSGSNAQVVINENLSSDGLLSIVSGDITSSDGGVSAPAINLIAVGGDAVDIPVLPETLPVVSGNIVIEDGSLIEGSGGTSTDVIRIAGGELIIDSSFVGTSNSLPAGESTPSVEIFAENIQLSNQAAVTTQASGPLSGGDIELESRNRLQLETAEISSTTETAGSAGNVTVTANELLVDG